MDVHILVIDDDLELCKLLKECLQSEGYVVDLAHTGIDALNMIERSKYDLLILDVMIPRLDGINVLKQVRISHKMPVLMLTAKDNEVDKILALKAGADDYITKPFSLYELIARVIAIIRRYRILGGDVKKKELSFDGNLKINVESMKVTINNQEIILTAKEYELLYFFASNPGQVFTKKQIYSEVWKSQYAYDDNNIMVHIRRLRKKIEPNTDKPLYIQTVWGIGYRFNSEVYHD